jgi:hypothetical protein
MKDKNREIQTGLKILECFNESGIRHDQKVIKYGYNFTCYAHR